MKFTVIVTQAPYGRENSYTALRFALTSLIEGQEVNIFLVQDGIYLAKKTQAPGEFPNFQEILSEAIVEGAKVKICTPCMEARGVNPEEFIDGVEMATMHDLVKWTCESDKVITFWSEARLVKADDVLDVRKRICPIPVLLTRRKLDQMESGKILKVIGDYPASKENIVRFIEQQGHEILEMLDELKGYKILIKVR